jgi:uncharacterized membrane protein YfcA
LKTVILAALGALSLWFVARWIYLERRRLGRARPGGGDVLIGFGTNFFDALGIGNFATTTALFKVRRHPADENIPGTLNAGHSLPVVVEAFIFISVVTVDPTTLVSMIAAAVLGAWLGVGFVSRLSRRAIQGWMGAALLIAALLMLATNIHLLPAGGEATGLSGGTLAFAVAVNFLLGAVMMVGVGMYAPCMILVCMLGMSPLAAFPIMMGACAFLMPTGGERFIKSGRYDFRTSVGLTLGGIPGVLVAALIVKTLPLVWLRWLVVVVVVYAATAMLLSARQSRVTATGAVTPDATR